MKNKFVLLCAIAVLGILPLVAQGIGPRLEFDRITVDLGQVADGEVLHHVFKFTNKGDSALEIREIQSSCGCMSTLLTAKTVAPGQSGELDVKIVTADAFASSGSLSRTVPILKTATITTNDRRQPSVIVVVRAALVPEIAFSESSISFGTHPRGEEVVREVLVDIAPSKPIRITSAASTDESVTALLEPVPGSGERKIKLIATLKATASEGQHDGFVLVNTSSALKPQLKIPVRGTVTKRISSLNRCAPTPMRIS